MIEEFTPEIEKKLMECFESSKEIIAPIIEDETLQKGQKFRLLISFLALLINSIGEEFYPVFNRGELHSMFARIEGFIRSFTEELRQKEEESFDEEPSDEKEVDFLTMILKMADDISSGKAKVKHVKVET